MGWQIQENNKKGIEQVLEDYDGLEGKRVREGSWGGQEQDWTDGEKDWGFGEGQGKWGKKEF